ncbi:M56 family metallopeptidase [Dyadobacter alkalitolerans]|uniref:M56 family metallopeptidase n=1 Tax=Dyadobacter alkalitolerans TaxID=492736 RepID=UPI00040665C7|nr:M56 family metallopeptidase [Dyadobacter alkalitolerans]
MNFNELYFQKLVQALSLTLIHSLWQGLIAAVLAGIILILTRKAKPALRYNLLATLLLTFVIASSYTFFQLLMSAKGVSKTAVMGSLTATNQTAVSVIFDGSNAVSAGDQNVWIGYLLDFCNRNAQLIAAVWFIIFAFKSLQATAGFLYVQNIKKRNVHPLRESWQPRFDMLLNKLKVRQLIQVVESENVLVPMVIGFIKPVVIIPFGIFANLPEAQIEAIILHELAHIKRRDYLVNLIQIFCENVFFFNPALLWLLRLIREEREHCCDDLAISVMENKTSFVHALVSFQEYNLNGSAFEMAFSKKRNHLLDRIKRIIYNNNKPLNAMEKLFVTISLLTVAALSAAVSQDAPKSAPVQVKKVTASSMPAPLAAVEPLPVVVMNQDTLPKKKIEPKPANAEEEVEVTENISLNYNVDSNSNINIKSNGISTYSITVNGKHYEMVKIKDKITTLMIDGNEIPKEDFPKYQSEINQVLDKITEEHKKAEAQRKEADKHRATADQHRAAADAQRRQADEMRVLADKQRLQADEQRKQAEENRKVAEAHAARANVDRERFEGMQDNIIDDLKDAGVIKSKVDLSYKFNENELVVNGEKQPEALHQKLREKYMKDKNFEMLYNYGGKSGSSTGIHYKK